MSTLPAGGGTTDFPPALPLPSSLRTLQQLPTEVQEQAHKMVLHSVAHSMKFMKPEQDNPDIPEYAVATTFADSDFATFSSSLIWMETAVEGAFVQALTDALRLERRSGLYEWGANLRETQREVGVESKLVAVTALMGLRSHRMTLNNAEGIVYFTYVGDGHILAALLDPEGKVQHAQYVAPLMQSQEVTFAQGGHADIFGDLAVLYSLLTASDEEIELLV